jgi:uncharacterized protein (UPF0332 family)
MTDEGAVNLAAVRLEAAAERLREARDLIKTGHYQGAVVRAYFAIYKAAQAALALKRVDSKTHQAALILFQRHYVKTGLFPKAVADIAKAAKALRETADYDDYAEITGEEARREYAAAARFVAAVDKYFKEGKRGDVK